jgi:hypothetical protein
MDPTILDIDKLVKILYVIVTMNLPGEKYFLRLILHCLANKRVCDLSTKTTTYITEMRMTINIENKRYFTDWKRKKKDAIREEVIAIKYKCTYFPASKSLWKHEIKYNYGFDVFLNSLHKHYHHLIRPCQGNNYFQFDRVDLVDYYEFLTETIKYIKYRFPCFRNISFNETKFLEIEFSIRSAYLAHHKVSPNEPKKDELYTGFRLISKKIT